jgi:hypothetical protein
LGAGISLGQIRLGTSHGTLPYASCLMLSGVNESGMLPQRFLNDSQHAV